MSTTRLLHRPEGDPPPPPPASSQNVSINNNNNHQFMDMTLELPLFGQHRNSTMVGAILYVILLAFYAAIVVLSSWLFASFIQFLPAILCSCNVFLLAVTGILEKHLASQVRKEQRQGFLKFSEHLKPLVYLPFKVISFGTAGMLLLFAWCTELSRVQFPMSLLLRLICYLEVMWTAIFVGLYLWRVRKHHLSCLQPDAIRSLYSAVQPTSLGDLRYINGRLAEQQALLLHYQQENLRYLSEEILRLQESLSKYEHIQDGSAPQVDLIHLLAAREQELRAIMTERDQLQAELRLARSLIAERDSDIVSIQSINDKYVEENERLRAMLDEWSTRTAKLELALEAERISNAELQKKIGRLLHTSTE